jgi:carboxyl-terminal processing protease
VKSHIKTMLILVVLSSVLCVFTLGAFAGVEKREKQTDVYHDLEVFAKIVEKVSQNYVEEVDTHELILTAIDQMLQQLDVHSQYLEGLDFEDLMVSTRGEFGGLGIYIVFREDYPTVVSPIADTPGDRAGLRGGDQIVEIEGMPTKGWRTEKAVKYLRGDPGTDVKFKIRRPGSTEAIEYVLTREIINVASVPFYDTFGDIGYVKVSSFSKHTAGDLEKAIDELEKRGIKGLVIDLRQNPGGLLQAATEVSELFLEKDKLVVYTKGRLQNSNRKYYSSNRSVHKGYPVVVMINGASASASEIFAGALQDWDRAFVVGQTSFGKGTVQTVFNLSETEAIKLTTAKYYTPSGRSIHKDQREQLRETEPGMTAAERDTEGNAGTETADVAADKPVYYTSSGRMVYGGGGITPDLEFEPLHYTDLQRELERKAMAFTFAVEELDDSEITEDFRTDDVMLQRFYDFLDERGFEYDKKDLTEDNVAYIRTMVAREALNHKYGREAMYRVLLEADPEFQEVLTIMKEAPTLEKMFAYAEAQKGIKKASVE